MRLEHSFTVPVGVDEAWQVLTDIQRVAPCMPGAVLETVDGDNFTGSVKVKLGPIGLTYKGKASFVEKDAATHRAVIDARGRDARGNGTANAKITAQLRQQPDATAVEVITDLDITGKPAQFGRGVMLDVGNKLIGQFAECLARKLSGGAEPLIDQASADGAGAGRAEAESSPAPGATPRAAPGSIAPSGATPSTSSSTAARPTVATSGGGTGAPRAFQRGADVEPIDLLGSAGPAVAKRLVPLLGAAALGAMVGYLLRRRS